MICSAHSSVAQKLVGGEKRALGDVQTRMKMAQMFAFLVRLPTG
jgi:hypothetical protein